MSRTRYRWNKKTETLEVVSFEPAGSAGPAVLRPIDDYISPVTGQIICDHRQRADDLRRAGCIDAREAPTREQGGKIRAQNHERSFKEHMSNVGRNHFTE